ncbi:MAG: histidine phosphatase family protein [Luteolibacter sp.]
MPLHLYLIRHGETAWAMTARHTGITDIPLTENGVDQALELGPHLAGVSFAHILTSPRERARHTCKLAGLEGIPEIEPDLAEWNYGDYEGEKSADIRKDRPDWDVFRDGCPQGEMPVEILARADRLIARLRLLDGNVALFSHGQFGGILGARWIGLPLADARHFPLGTASISILGYDPDHPEVPVISLWNFISHPISNPVASDQAMKKQAISRWENEGGKIA